MIRTSGTYRYFATVLASIKVDAKLILSMRFTKEISVKIFKKGCLYY